MRSTSTKVAAALTLIALGAGTTLAMRPASPTLSAASPKAVVRVETQIVRRTIHVFKHVKPPVAGAPPPGVSVTRSAAAAGVSGAGRRPVAASGPATTPVRTRTSGAKTAPTPSAPPAAIPIRTRTSGAPARSPASRPVPLRTRTSGGGDDSHKHDD